MTLLLLLLACPTPADSDSKTPSDADGDGILATVDCDDSDAEVGLPTSFYGDSDGDGYGKDGLMVEECAAPSGFVANADDCDDGEAGVYPGAIEHCDSVDEDCDGTVDNSAVDQQIFYGDSDGDGFGNPNQTSASCTQPAGFVDNDKDCNDGIATISPDGVESCNSVDDNCDGMMDNDPNDGSTFYTDADGDGYGDLGSPVSACVLSAGLTTDASDCDDTLATVSPAGTELCNGMDDNCDGAVDEATAADAITFFEDADGDGYGNGAVVEPGCSTPPGFVNNDLDCDDLSVSIFPGASERCDGVDNDCDQNVDEEDATDAATWYLDSDSDGDGDGSQTVQSCTQPTGYAGTGGDCDDADPSISSVEPEICDSVDNNCDGVVDTDAVDANAYYVDADGDGYGDPTTQQKSCTLLTGLTTAGGDCDDADAAHSPATPETCDGTDENCNGTIDENPVDGTLWYTDADGDGYGDANTGVNSCIQPNGTVADASDCNDQDPAFTTTCQVGCSTIKAYNGDIYSTGFGSAAALSSFCSSYNAIDGNLTLDHTDLTSMSVFSCLCEVSGSLTITTNTNLTTLSGLDNLGSIGGDLLIDDNDKLTSYTGFTNLTTITGQLTEPGTNALITDFTGLSALKTIGSLDMEYTGLTSMDGLESLKEVVGDVYVYYNTNLTSLQGLSGLETVGGEFFIRYNQIVPTLAGLENLSTVGTNLHIRFMDGLTDLSELSGLTQVGNDVIVEYCSGLKDLTGLEGLTTVNGALTITDNTALEKLTGLDNLTDVAGALSVSGSAPLTNVDGLQNLASVGGAVVLGYYLEDVSGLAGLQSIGGGLTITSYGALADLQGLNQLQSVGGTFYLYDAMGTFGGFQGLDALTTVSGNLSINLPTNSVVTSMDGFNTLSTLSGSLDVTGPTGMTLTGLDSLTTIGGDLRVSSNFSGYTGLSKITTVGGYVADVGGGFVGLGSLQDVGTLYITSAGTDLVSLTSVTNLIASYNGDPTGLTKLTTIRGDLTLRSPTAFTSLNAVTTIGGDVLIYDPDYYVYTYSVSGLNALTTIGGDFTMGPFSQIRSYSNFAPNLVSVGGAYTVVGNTLMSVFNAQPMLQHVGSLSISANSSLQNVYFGNLTTIDDDFSISDNYYLNDVTTFNTITSIGGDFTLSNNGISTTQANTLRDTIGISNIGGVITISE